MSKTYCTSNECPKYDKCERSYLVFLRTSKPDVDIVSWTQPFYKDGKCQLEEEKK